MESDEQVEGQPQQNAQEQNNDAQNADVNTQEGGAPLNISGPGPENVATNLEQLAQEGEIKQGESEIPPTTVAAVEQPIQEGEKQAEQPNVDPLVLTAAIMTHTANKKWCELNGDNSQEDWDKAPEWQKESAINGVQFVKDNPSAHPREQHENWSIVKIKDGWVYGEEKDAEKKTHPCLLPYEQLPEFQRKKDAIFGSICRAILFS